MASSRSRAITDPDPASGAGTIRGEAAGVVFERTGGPGAGPPLLLVHGLGASLRIWDPQVARLARERDVIAVDMPGFGDSPLLTGGESPTPWALAAALARLCDELGIERPHVAGNSLGGWVAIEMAKRDEVSTLCLISPAGLWRRPLGPRARDTRGVAKRLKPLVGPLVRSRRGREALLRTTAARPALIPPGEARELITTWIDAPGYDAANQFFAEDFDGQTLRFTQQGGQWQVGAPVFGPSAAVSGQSVVGTAMSQGTYSANANAYLISREIDLTQATTATLSMKQWYETDGIDAGRVLITPDGGTTYYLLRPAGGYSQTPQFNPGEGFTGASNGWVDASYDLGQFVGSRVTIVLQFGSDANDQRAGWYIDDFVVRGN